MTRKKNEPAPHDTIEELREEVERLRLRLSELESRLGESQDTITTLQKSEQLYRTILENIPPVTYVFGVGNEPLNSGIYTSLQIEKIVGHTIEEFLKDPLLWVNIIHPEDRESVLAKSQHADLTGGPLDAEYRVISSDNGILWFHDTSVLVKDERGQPLYRVGIFIDVTERKQAELALQQLDDIYRRAIDAAGAVPYLISHDGPWQYNYIGEGIHSLTGYSAEEMTAEIWDSLCLEVIPRGRLASLTFEEADRLTNEDNSVLWECDFHIRTRDGRERWIADTSVKNFDEKSGRLTSVGIYQDITENKLSQIARQRAEDQYRRAIVSAGAVPYALDHSTNKILFIGEGILAMTGYSASEMMDSNQWNSVVEEGFPRGNLAHLTFEEANRLTDMDRSIPWECDFRIRTRDGQIRWIADTSVKNYDKDSNHLISIGIKQDITERKQAEELQKELIHELEHRNAELERIAYTLSHELKSPLITIRGFLGYLREDAISGNTKRLDQDIQRITDGTEKMLRLINELIQLMSMGRILHEFKEMSLRAVMDESVELVQERLAPKKITVLIADDLSHVYGDHKLLVEVFQNLLENAVKFMGEQPEPKIEIGQRYEEGDIHTFYVRDNGIGIDPRFAERIFGIFHKLDTLSEGTGIGLALVKRIIEVHGGKIWVESEGLGKGSTFCFTISAKQE